MCLLGHLKLGQFLDDNGLGSRHYKPIKNPGTPLHQHPRRGSRRPSPARPAMGHNFQLLLSTLSRLVRRTSARAVGARRRLDFLPGVLRLSSRRASCCLLRRWRAACDLAFAASDCRCCIFVRLAGASDWYWLSRATSVVKCAPASCTAAASVHVCQSRRWLALRLGACSA